MEPKGRALGTLMAEALVGRHDASTFRRRRSLLAMRTALKLVEILVVGILGVANGLERHAERALETPKPIQPPWVEPLGDDGASVAGGLYLRKETGLEHLDNISMTMGPASDGWRCTREHSGHRRGG